MSTTSAVSVAASASRLFQSDTCAASTSLQGTTVHAWSASLEPATSLAAQWESVLSPDEHARADRFVFERDRRRFVAGRVFLRLLLARYLSADPAQLRFRYGSFGKPELLCSSEDLQFNLAHSETLAICVLAKGCELGVDLERLRPLSGLRNVASHFFSARENEDLNAVPEKNLSRAFFNAWTRKEAFLKATGNGLSRPLDSFDVTLLPGQPARLTRTFPVPEEAGRFSLCSFEPQPGYIAAIAIKENDWRVSHMRWSWSEAAIPSST